MKAVIIYLIYFVVLGDSFPSNFQKCSRTKANFNECLKTALNHRIAKLGIAFPEIGLPRIDPLEIGNVTIAPGVHGIFAVEQKYQDCRAYGFSSAIFDKIVVNFADKNLYYEFNVDNVTLFCHYDFDGKVLTLPIFGNGRLTLDIEGFKVRSNSTWLTTAKNGKTYLQFNTPHTFTVDANSIKFNFNNLFNGDKIRGNHMNKLLSDNWVLLYADVRDEEEKTFGLIIKNVLNQFFSKISVEDVFD